MYQNGKERAREKAKDWQLDLVNHSYAWSEMAEFAEYFTKIGKRYGLLKEFRENGII